MNYFENVIYYLNKVNDTQTAQMNAAAKAVKNAIVKGGLVYIFGCGHSHLLGLDCFYRAGGLANVYPILKESLMLHESASLSSVLEKDERAVAGLLDGDNIGKNDVLFVISTSGKNGAPVDVALQGKNKGVTVVTICSSEYFSEASKHSSHKLLKDVGDVVIDNCVPHGDAVLDIVGGGVKSAPVSTAVTSFIMQNVIALGEKLAVEEGAHPDVFMSGNVEGGAEFNKALIEKYKPLVKCL